MYLSCFISRFIGSPSILKKIEKHKRKQQNKRFGDETATSDM